MNSKTPTNIGIYYGEKHIAEFFEQDQAYDVDFDIALRMSLDKGDIQDIFDYARFN